MPESHNSYKSCSKLILSNETLDYFSLAKLNPKKVSKLPFGLKILLENLLRKEDGISVTKDHIETLINWDPKAKPSKEIAFTPARVILQDFTGVPAIVDLAAMRDAMVNLNADPDKINPLSQVDLVIDHSVMVDAYGSKEAFETNVKKEFERNKERYQLLKWGQQSFKNFRVVPPGTGIVHQVNLEYLASVVFQTQDNQNAMCYFDTLVGTDSHTTMINGLGVLGWGVGGIEAEAAMLGQPISLLIPEVVGFKLTGELPTGTTATDLVLMIVEILRQKGVVGKFVEFYGEGLQHLSLADRATIANMAPEYGATCGLFPVDQETLDYMRLSGRDEKQIELVEKYAKAQGVFHDENSPEAEYSETISLDLSAVEPSIAGPSRPQDRIALKDAKYVFEMLSKKQNQSEAKPTVHYKQQSFELTHGAVGIAAITSCTNTSNPEVMIAAGLLAKNAADIGLTTKPWVKTSLAPGSQVVTDYFNKANLTEPLEKLGFHTVGYGCTTCIGNSGPLAEEITEAVQKNDLNLCAVLSGNRNFEGRIHPLIKNAYLASPPLVVAYALAGRMDFDFEKDCLGVVNGTKYFLRDIWPEPEAIQSTMQSCISPEMFSQRYQAVFDGEGIWHSLSEAQSKQYRWDQNSSYIQNPPFFDNMPTTPAPLESIQNAHVLVKLGDSVTTDHISPAGSIALQSPAGKYLANLNIPTHAFNSYGARRGNHEVMMRGTFANIRLKNQLVPGSEGSVTIHIPSNEKTSIYDAAMRYRQENIPLVVLAGKEYGSGSSRDWAAKGTRLLGVRMVLAESFERIHRSNLIGMGVLPVEFLNGKTVSNLNLSGLETFNVDLTNLSPQAKLNIQYKTEQGETKSIEGLVRIDTPKELDYYKHGGILQYVLRGLKG